MQPGSGPGEREPQPAWGRLASTSLNGTPVASEDALSAALAKTHAGQRVTLGWVDEYGTAHQSTLTLIAGPAA